jgi:pyruvate/2-oxoglutarate dehydrogenase complex dihydrolipoamide dehydrogenase (E3) component
MFVLSAVKPARDVRFVNAVAHFDSTTRTVIDGHKIGFCKLIVDRKTCKILGCHVIGERAVDIAEVAAIAIAAGDASGRSGADIARLSTHAAVLVRAAVSAAHQLKLTVGWRAHEAA